MVNTYEHMRVDHHFPHLNNNNIPVWPDFIANVSTLEKEVIRPEFTQKEAFLFQSHL